MPHAHNEMYISAKINFPFHKTTNTEISLIFLEVPEERECKISDDCGPTQACLNRFCVNPCTVGNPCAITAQCEVTNHKALCRCPSGLLGDPFIRCYEIIPSTPECKLDSDCSYDKACISQRCQDPCLIANPCGTNAQCKTTQHRPICLCPDGLGGNPQVLCYKRKYFLDFRLLNS